MRRKRSAQSVSNRAHTTVRRASSPTTHWHAAVASHGGQPQYRTGVRGTQGVNSVQSPRVAGPPPHHHRCPQAHASSRRGCDSLIASLIPVWLLHPCAVLSLALLNVLGRQERLHGLLDELAGARDAVDRALFHPDVLARDRLTHLLSEKRRVDPSLVERKGTIGWCTLVAVARGIPDQRRNPRQSAPISVHQR